MQTRGSSRAGQLQCGLRRLTGDGARVRVASQAGSGGQCAKDRARARGEKINLVIAVARAKDVRGLEGKKIYLIIAVACAG